MTGLTPKNICLALDWQIIATYKHFKLRYKHSGVRGYYICSSKVGRQVYVGGDMQGVCRSWNAFVRGSSGLNNYEGFEVDD